MASIIPCPMLLSNICCASIGVKQGSGRTIGMSKAKESIHEYAADREQKQVISPLNIRLASLGHFTKSWLKQCEGRVHVTPGQMQRNGCFPALAFCWWNTGIFQVTWNKESLAYTLRNGRLEFSRIYSWALRILELYQEDKVGEGTTHPRSKARQILLHRSCWKGSHPQLLLQIQLL